MDLKYLESIRLFELESALREINKKNIASRRVLEIGAGSGWQSKKLTDIGYSVEAIDIESSNYSSDRVWPVTNYDGKNIPFPDNFFDIVFSSNVLEHIPHLIEFQNEIKRVLNPDGIAIHIVPSGSWRFWTNITHYLFILKIMKNFITKKLNISINHNNNESIIKIKSLPKLTLFRKSIFASRHGETGSVLTELYYFSQYRWLNIFKKTDWKIEKILKNGLFYTGYGVFGSALPLTIRRHLSHILGSSCHIFVIRKAIR